MMVTSSRPPMPFLLSTLVAALLLTPLVAGASAVQDGATPGEKVYLEDFTDPSAVDAGAGATAGLDQTEIDAFDRLLQITGSTGTFVTDFEDPAAYDFDPARVEVSGGLARLADSIHGDLIGYWRMEEASWNGTAGEVIDGTGSGFHGTAGGDATTTAAGRVGRAGTFDGAGDFVGFGQPAALDLDPAADEFTVAAWFRTAGDGAILGKAVDDVDQRQYYLFVWDGRLWATLGGAQNAGASPGVNDGQWHHGAVVNFNDNGTMKYRIYLDGVLDGEFVSGTSTNAADLLLGARRATGNTGLGFQMNGQVDEAMIVGRALSPAEVASLYAGGSGRVVSELPADRPAIFETSGDSALGLTGFTGFTETLGAGNQGSVGYQLATDGVSWRYWDGAAWTLAGGPADVNDAATVDANVAAFDATAQAIWVRAFLISDGSQAVELDRVEVGFERSFAGAFVSPFDDPAAYTFDPARIVVQDGRAKLAATPALFDDALGYWRFEEAAWNGTPGEVEDLSGNGHHGTAGGDATTLAGGKIGRAGTFDGAGDFASFGQPPELQLDPANDEFTLAAWFRTTGDGAVLGKAVEEITERQYYLFVWQDQLYAAVGGEQNPGVTVGVADGQWHHGAVVNFDDAGTMRYRIYLDGALEGEFLSGAGVNLADVLVGARRISNNAGTDFDLAGEVDEALIVGRALSSAEIGELYNAGAGVVRTFPSVGPTIFETAGDVDPSLLGYTDFLAAPGPGHQGGLAYQLSTDGVDWRYWDGAAWSSAAAATDRNDAATVDANIAAFDAAPQSLYVRTFLLSDGRQGAEIDQVTARYDSDGGFGATESLGPVTAGFRFTTFTASVADEDADHSITFRFLGADGATPIPDAQIPGNSTGFDSSAAAAGVDLTGVGAGDLYVEVNYTNVNADNLSAALVDFQVTYLDFNDDSDLAVTKSASPDPVVRGDDLGYAVEVTNAGPSDAFDATLADDLPAGTTFVSLVAPPGWSCTTPAVGSGGTVSCDHPLLPVGGPYLFSLVVNVPGDYAGPDPIVNTATVGAAKDTDAADNSATATAGVSTPPPGTITIAKDADPALGTDFSFFGDLGTFTLDDAVPDDADGVPASLTFPGLPPGLYQVSEIVPTGWQLSDLSCTSNTVASTFVTPYDDPTDYTYDVTEIEVTGGVAQLIGDPLEQSLLGYWRMEEAGWNGTPGEVIDDSGNGHHGTAAGDATTIAGGRIGRGGTFDGAGDFVDLGQPAPLDLDPAVDDFTFTAWFRTTGDGALVAKAAGPVDERQLYLFVWQDRLWANVGGSQNASGSLGVATDGQWHHGAVAKSGGSYTLYLDGDAEGSFPSGTAVNAADLLIGARRDTGNTGSAFAMNGDVDEVAIFDRALTATEIFDLYNSGAGRIIGLFPDDAPTIVKTVGDSDPEILGFTGFTEVLGPGNEGSVEYQLSTDGSSWQYWDGAAWVAAGIGQRNDAATVDANVPAFDDSAGSIHVRAFLVSDGSQRVVVDELRIDYDGSGLGGITLTGNTASMELASNQDLACTFVNTVDPEQAGSITVIKSADPRDGTDFTYTGDLGAFTLDDASPDDGDPVPSSRTFSNLPPESYQVTEALPAGWELDDFTCTSTAIDETFLTPFTSSANYTFDPTDVDFRRGVVRLRAHPLDPALLGYWRMDEELWNGTAGEVEDLSGNGHHGVRRGDATTVAGGKIVRAGTFDGSGDAVEVGQPPDLDLDPAVDEFTLTAWFKTSTEGAIISKGSNDFDTRQYYMFVFEGQLWGVMGGEHNAGATVGVNDGQWHHGAVVNYDDAGTMRYRIYLDGALDGEFLSGTATNPFDVLLGARRLVDNATLGFMLNGQIDEAAIIGRALSAAEVADLYNAGAGRIQVSYADTGPAVYKTLGDTAAGISLFTSFSAIPGFQNEGFAEYQLSTDGSSWQYWDGVAWVPAGAGQRNDAGTVDANVGAFDASADAIYVRSFLVSDGDQRVEIDEIEIGYQRTTGTPTFSLSGTTASVELGPAEELECTFSNRETAPAGATVTVVQLADPTGGTDFAYTGDLGAFTLDDAAPDDADGVAGSITFNDVAPGSYQVSQGVPAAWVLLDVTCTSTDPSDTSTAAGNVLTLDVDAGETLTCTFFDMERLTQLTSSTGPFRASHSATADEDGTVLSFASIDDPVGTNADGGSEIFVYTRAGWEQITSVTDPAHADHAGRSALSLDGRWVVFESTADLLGSNADGNVEVYRFDRLASSLTQVTFTTGCDNVRPTVSGDGTRIAFATNCTDLTPGFNADGNLEAVLWDDGTFEVQETMLCDNLEPAISRHAEGRWVAFHASCNEIFGTGNDDRNYEAFQWDWQAASAVQVTDSSDLLSETNETVSSDAAGRYLVFASNADYLGTNPDQGLEIYRWDRLTSSFLQLTDEDAFVSHSNAAVDADGRHVVYERFDFNTFHLDVYHVDAVTGVTAPVALGGTTWDVEFPAVAELGGKAIVVFQTAGDLTGGNPDGNVEVFRAVVD